MEEQYLMISNPVKSVLRLIKNFFTPEEAWGRQNRSQFFIGLLSAMIYLLVNFLFKSPQEWNPFLNSTNGLVIAVYVCIAIAVAKIIGDVVKKTSQKYPWYERYMPVLITLLGLITLIAFQNLDGTGFDDAGLWINIVVLLVVFIIAAGYFVEGSSNEKVIKIWFALLGYFFSVIAFFYFLESLLFNKGYYAIL